MKFLLDNWYWLAAALASGIALLWTTLAGTGGANAVTTQDAVQLMNREKAVLLDVSEAAEYAAGHITGARSMPLATLAEAKALPTNKSLPIILVCPTGNRAQRGVSVLTGLGYQRVHVLAGGMAAWREANLPVEKSA